MNLYKRCCNSLCSATSIESDNAQTTTMLTYKHAVVTLSATRTTGPSLRQCRCDERLAHAHWRDNQHSKLHRIQPSAMQPVNQVRSIGSENELQKYRLSEFLVVSEGDSGISPSSKVPRRVRSIWAHFRFSHFMPMDLGIMPTVLDISYAGFPTVY